MSSNNVLRTKNSFWKYLASIIFSEQKYHLVKSAKIASDVMFGKTYDPILPLLPQILSENSPIIFDIGANMGQFAARLSRLFNTGTIYSFEPIQQNFDGLRRVKAWLQLRNVLIHRIALCDTVGTEKMHIPVFKNSFKDGALAVLERSKREFVNVSYVIEETPTDTIDSFARNLTLNRLDFIKIDTEGAENRVIEGGWDTIRFFLPVMYIESPWDATYLRKLYALDFVPFHVASKSLYSPVNGPRKANTLLVHGSKIGNLSNILALP